MGMRRATQGTDVMRLSGGEIVGVSLGHDFTAEHEWGKRDLMRDFGVGVAGTRGIEKRLITTVPEGLVLEEIEAAQVLHYEPHAIGYAFKDTYGWREFRYHSEKVEAAWCEASFAIAAWQGPERGALALLHHAFLERDIAFGFSIQRSAWPASSGLSFVIASRVPDEVRREVEQADDDHVALLKAAEATGVEAILRKAGKRWFALSPRWKNWPNGEVVFWLNPMEQDRHNYGWFSPEDLLAWAEDKGPIPMTAAQRQRR